MRLSLIAVLAASLTTCSAPKGNNEALMEVIEQQVQLPKGARPLQDYARYYTAGDNGDVMAVYLIPFNNDPQPNESCEELTENLSSRAVPCDPMRPAWAMPAGQRRWVKDQQDLPFMDDGGCAQVAIVFDKSRSVVKSAECNGGR